MTLAAQTLSTDLPVVVDDRAIQERLSDQRSVIPGAADVRVRRPHAGPRSRSLAGVVGKLGSTEQRRGVSER
jgi:hypothetical protein